MTIYWIRPAPRTIAVRGHLNHVHLRTRDTNVDGGTARVSPGSSAREWFEVAVAYGLLEAALWSGGRTQQIWGVATLVWAILATVLSRRSARELGIAVSGLRRSAWIAPASLGFAGLMVATAYLAGTAHVLSGAHNPPSHVALYCVWAMLQEFLLQSFILVRLEAALRSGTKAVVLTAVLFALAHIPNPILVPATLLSGLVLTELFRRYRNIYALGIAHAIFGLAVAISLPEALTHNMRVGLAYWN